MGRPEPPQPPRVRRPCNSCTYSQDCQDDKRFFFFLQIGTKAAANIRFRKRRLTYSQQSRMLRPRCQASVRKTRIYAYAWRRKGAKIQNGEDRNNEKKVNEWKLIQKWNRKRKVKERSNLRGKSDLQCMAEGLQETRKVVVVVAKKQSGDPRPCLPGNFLFFFFSWKMVSCFHLCANIRTF